MASDVLVVGGGMAGISGAIELSRSGLHVEILEARDRMGGRIFAKLDPTLNYPIELGAEFVHGLAPEIWLPLQQHKLKVNEVSGDLWCSMDGKLQPCDFFAEADEILSAMEDRSPDESFLQFLARRFSDTKYERAKQWATRYVSGFNAADPGEVSVHWLVHNRRAEEQTEGDRAFRIHGGYEALLDIFESELKVRNVVVHLNTFVREIIWSKSGVTVNARNDRGDIQFQAHRALVTLPLGVLQSNAVCFKPGLPEPKLDALKNLVMGKVVRVTLCFRESVWQNLRSRDDRKTLGNLSFLFSEDDFFPTWWTQMPEHVPIITGWAPARSAEQLSGMTEGRVTDKALDSLSALLGLEKARLQKELGAAYFHDWDSDPFSCGAYSYVKAGGEGCQADLALPLGDVLFFAGEATDISGNNGTVQGAIASGKRAARQIRAAT